jgi:putative colanic acid biosynthesis UDP-glucose lipid carrier transferase
MGAAHADDAVPKEEEDSIRELLCDLLHADELPERLENHMEAFDFNGIDLNTIGDEIENSDLVGRRTLLEMTRVVCDADGQIDLREDNYMLALATALSLEPEEYNDVVFDSPFRGWKALFKRIEDIILGTVFLLISALPMIAVALAVKLTSRGPILFRQRRYGENGAEFEMLKFRSMTVTEDGDTVTQAKRDDPRVTRVGRIIRKTSLDELPQFINVIKGDMSVVGPRPHAVAHNEQYRKEILEYMRRHKVKPGITGWAQVNGYRGETDTLDKMVKRVEHDLAYIRNWRIWLDIKIIFQTVWCCISRKNAF